MKSNEITSKIIEASIRVHRELGPGLLETIYQSCLVVELREMRVNVEAEVPLSINYRKKQISDDGYRVDLVVEGEVLVELKSVESVKPVHKKQLLSYLRLANKQVGLLINFNCTMLRDGICRIINPLYSE